MSSARSRLATCALLAGMCLLSLLALAKSESLAVGLDCSEAASLEVGKTRLLCKKELRMSGLAPGELRLASGHRVRMAPAAVALLGLAVDVNHASLDELDTLPGVGPTLGLRVVEGRPYESVGELIHLRGIGPKKLEALRARARVGLSSAPSRPLSQ